MKARRVMASALMVAATAGVLAAAAPASAADYYCSSGPYTVSGGKQAEATCQSFSRQVRIAADCDWSPFNIYSNAFNSNLEYRKTNGSCSNGIVSAWIAWA